MKLFLVLLFQIIPFFVFCQSRVGFKKEIGEDVLSKWYWLDDGKWDLSPDGNFASWVIINQPYRSRTLVLADTEGGWRREFSGERGGFFAADSRRYILPMQNKIAVITLGKEIVRYIDRAERLCQGNEGRWMAYQIKGSGMVFIEQLLNGRSNKVEALTSFEADKSGTWLVGRPAADSTGLLLYHVLTGKRLRYSAIKSYQINDDGNVLLLQTQNSDGNKLKYVGLPDGKESLVYATRTNQKFIRYCLDRSGIQVAFMLATKEKGEFRPSGNSIWFYNVRESISRKTVDDSSISVDRGLFVSVSKLEFTRDGRYIFFNLEHRLDDSKAKPDAVHVDIWSHRDIVLYTGQYDGFNPAVMVYPSVVPVTGSKVTMLTRGLAERLVGDVQGIVGDNAIVIKGKIGDRFWEYSRDSVWAVSLQTGSRKLLPFTGIGWPNILELDQKGKSVIGFDRNRGRHLYKYDINSGVERKLSEGIADWQLGIENSFLTGWPATKTWVNPVIAGRTRQGDALLVYDNYDLWQIDLSGKKRAMNLTNGYGRQHKTVFRLALPKEALGSGPLLLTAFNEVNKSNGFYRTAPKLGDPDSLLMGPYFFYHSRLVEGNLMPEPNGAGMLPLKARDAAAWLVCRESATEAPNYYFTRDFKQYRQLTHHQPQQGYNWYTTELVNFIQADGIQNQGILYKPEDFDSTKKYPVLFHYYEQYSHTLNRFIAGRVSETGNPNIPWYVSRGYLVFRPDHYFKRVDRDQSVLLAVEGAARELMKRSYVDVQRLGLMGLSQAGGFTNYIITHSNLFGAAFEGCGVSDRVSAALQLTSTNFKGGSRLESFEKNFGINMWENSQEFVHQSPIMKASKVTTPLLIMHNKSDGAVLFEQAIELFTALRRLCKRVWLLQYDDGNHGVTGKDALDLTRRMTQYFDHYLKGLPPPGWMTQSIPRGLKGIETGFELDPEGSCGKDCKICQEKKYSNTIN